MKKIILLPFLLLIIASCSLDRYPLDTESVGSYYADEAQLRTATNLFYQRLLPGSGTIWESASDLYFGSKGLTALQRGGNQRKTPSSDGDNWNWTTLRSINELLDAIDVCPDKDAVKKYKGISYFFRAYFYWLKLRDFGGVPWFEHPLSTVDPDLYKARDSRDFIAGKILEDLDRAIAMLPDGKEAFRITKWEALAVKSRVALFEGTWHKYHDEFTYEKDADYYLKIAAEAADEFMASSPYVIYNTGNPATDYQAVFAGTTENPGVINEAEVMFGRNYKLTMGQSHFASRSTWGDNGMCVNKKFVDMFLMADGTRFTDQAGWDTKQFYDEMTGRDPRLSQIVRCPGYHRIGGKSTWVPSFTNSLTGYNCCKYAVSEELVATDGAWSGEDTDLPVFRMAEVLLNYAEAQAERSDYNITQDDIDKSIKLLRDRAGMPNLNVAAANASPDDNYLGSAKYGYTNVKGANKGVILEIRRERAVELAQELDFRWYDLMRWKAGKCMTQDLRGMYFPGYGDYDLDNDGTMDICVHNGTVPGTSTAAAQVKVATGASVVFSDGNKGYIVPYSTTKRNFDEERDYLFPLPTDEIGINPKLEQNPGWDMPKETQ